MSLVHGRAYRSVLMRLPQTIGQEKLCSFLFGLEH